jgi:hypothetical protein
MSLVADCFSVLLIDDTGKIFASTTLQSADIDIKVDSKEIRAGRGDALISVLHSGRQVDIKLAEATFKYDWIAKQLGTTIGTAAAAVAWVMPKFYTAATTTGVTITLDPKPIATSSGIEIYTSAGVLIPAANYSVVAGTGVTTFTSGVTAGDIVEVRGYKYTTAATATTVTIDNVSFADGVICVLETLEIDEDETNLAKVQYIFDEVLPSGSLTISTKKERDASITNIELKAIKPRTSDTIGRVIRIPV